MRITSVLLALCSVSFLAPATSCAADPPSVEAVKLLRRADSAYSDGKYAEAAEAAEKAAGLDPRSASTQQGAAQLLFLSGQVEKSLPYFDKANELDPMLAPDNWQRGVALGCAGKFEAGAEQFKIHHDVNPNDVENSAWYFLCVAKTKGIEAARATVIPSGGDAREPMMSVLKMLRGTLTPDEVLVAAKSNTKEGPSRKMALFYGFLYVGLYYDSIGEGDKASAALDSAIANGDKHYMGRTTQLYRELRFPKKDPTAKSADAKTDR